MLTPQSTLFLKGILYTCNVLSEPENRHALAQAVALLVQARQVAIFGIGASGILADYTARLFEPHTVCLPRH